MRKTWTLGATGAALAAVLGAGGCYDFDEAKRQCIEDGRCEPEGVGPDAGDAGDGSDAGDAGFDAGCTRTSDVDPPDDAFADENCDGVDGEANTGLFVDPENGDDQGAGTLASPLRTLGHAMELLRRADGGGLVRRLYLAGGAYNENGLVLDVPASLHGGYIRGTEQWTRAGNNPARLNGGSVGLTVRDLRDAGIVLEYVHVRSADAVGAGEPSIALRVLNASGVELRRLTLEAGLGGAGTDGGAGTRGQAGLDGGTGTPGEGNDPGIGGAVGVTSCAESDRSGGGGAGGVIRTPGLAGSPGKPDAGGGDAGGGATVSCPQGASTCNCDGLEGGPGLPGTFGAEGPSGTQGRGRGTLDLVVGAWRADQQGGSGDAGLPGEGGGGGGSGGSCTSTLGFNPGASGGGGGGGGGGCGGTGGQGGGGGGASIALLLVDAQVAAGPGTQLRTRGGGPGGAGGAVGEAGPGGEGGGGGLGGSVSQVVVTTRYNTSGGNGGGGGKGGNGGRGGAGGGGGGGPSVGVWCGPDAGVAQAENVAFTLGDGGAGGPSTGNAGEPGEQLPTVGCQNP